MAARSDASGGGLKSAGVQRVIGVVALVVTALAIGAVRMGFIHLPGSQDEDSVLAKGNESTTSTPAPAMHVAKAPAGGAEAVNLDAPAAEPGDAPPATGAPASTPGVAPLQRRPGSRLASTGGSSAAVVTAVTPESPRRTAQMAHLDEHVTYQYNALGRRDPFQSLIGGEFTPVNEGGDAPPDPGGMKIVGIVWGASDQFAMVEDVRGNSYVLRKGDKLQNGYVEALRRDAVVVNITADGQSQQVVIPFVRKGDANVR
jgi:Tfp pilus assembly protein PilP